LERPPKVRSLRDSNGKGSGGGGRVAFRDIGGSRRSQIKKQKETEHLDMVKKKGGTKLRPNKKLTAMKILSKISFKAGGWVRKRKKEVSLTKTQPFRRSE